MREAGAPATAYGPWPAGRAEGAIALACTVMRRAGAAASAYEALNVLRTHDA
ncbi:hypothetical protein [Actinomadura sp. DC4]|uniref:hypothetical protein n=1 Tax=Actinomadura sp. DC4 TaxID=3055069 RepID=UPI0025B0FE60|nr:hypothetical protein [Actinomadura sp. DC4]MDN3359576.1 hypothetical protein [Actinomadura sp. DC4]